MSDNMIEPGKDGAVQPPIEGFSDWVQQTRTQAIARHVPEPAPKPMSPWPRRLRVGLRVGALLALGWCSWVWGQHAFRTTTGVHGQLSDREGLPVAGAWVFLSSNPEVETTTDQDGVFHLPRVPLGQQTVVIAQDGAGQEFRFRADNQSTIDLGNLVYRVPPLRVRRSPGSGAGWMEP
jgi:hypothetical protein